MQTLSMSTPQGWSPPPQWSPPQQAPLSSAQPLTYQVRTSHRATNVAGSRGCLMAAIISLSVALFTCIPFGGVFFELGNCNTGGGSIGLPVMPSFQPASPTPEPQLAPGQPPSLGVLDLSSAAGPLTVSGSATPQVNVGLLGQPGCIGYAPVQPHAVVRVGSLSQVTVVVTGAELTTVVLHEPNSAFHCSRIGMTDSRFGVLLPPGDHPLWVAVPSPMSTAAFGLTVSAVATGGTSAAILHGLVTDAPPTLGIVDLAERRPSRSFEGQIAGAVEADGITSGCRGYLTAAPQTRIRLAEPTALTIDARSEEDLTLLVRLANGTVLCDDDSGHGTNPRIVHIFEAGEHSVWVGTYHENRTAQVTLQVNR